MIILYGITANGNGHLARSTRIVQMLRKNGHRVELLISGEPKKSLMNDQDYEPYQRCDGFSFENRNGKLSPWMTFVKAKKLLFLKNLFFSIPLLQYDLVITDFEPLTAWYAKLRGIHSIALCHMYAFIYPQVPSPKSRWYERLMFRWLAPANIMLGLHWFPYNQFIIPPFIQPPKTTEIEGDLVLVYLPWEKTEDYLQSLFSISHYRFIVYEKNRTTHEKINNVELKPQDRHTFPYDLDRSCSVIANAGFALASEAVSKGKRLMLKPYAGQGEQEHNAKEAAELGLATNVQFITPQIIDTFLESTSSHHIQFPDVGPMFVQWIESGAKEMNKETHATFWPGFF